VKRDDAQQPMTPLCKRMLYERERLNAQATELLALLLDKQGVTPQELSERLGKSRSFVSQVLSGSRSVSVGTLSDMFVLLDKSLHVFVGPLGSRHYPQEKASLI